MRALETRLRLAERDLEELQARSDIIERERYFYRRQLVLEARYGLLIQRVFGDPPPPGTTLKRERSGSRYT